MCGKTDILRDKDFDSLVHAEPVAAEPAQVAKEYKPTHGGYPAFTGTSSSDDRLDALDRAADIAVDGAAQVARAELLSKVRAVGFDPPLEVKKEIVNGIIAPFYQGAGKIDHVGLLNQLQVNKGSALTQRELQVWGGVAGIYSADRLSAEIAALPADQQADTLLKALLSFA